MPQAFTWWGGALVGLLAWSGFVLATHLPLWAYENRPLQAHRRSTWCSNLVSMVLMGDAVRHLALEPQRQDCPCT